MRAFVAVTDRDWFEFLRARPFDEVNFWQPSARRPFGAINPGDLFLFKLRYPEHKIVGGGMLAWSGTFPYPYVWELFGEKNGAAPRSTPGRSTSGAPSRPADPLAFKAAQSTSKNTTTTMAPRRRVRRRGHHEFSRTESKKDSIRWARKLSMASS